MSSNETKRGPEFFETMRKRFKLAEEALQDLHSESEKDWGFRIGDEEHTWNPQVLAARKEDGRPVFSINRVPQFMRQVTGEQKRSRPAIQVSPIGDGSDEETAKIMQGLVRHIERTSDASEAYDTAFEHMITGGFGFLRLVTDYVDSESDDQEICFRRELNPFAHYPDPRCRQRDYSDARFWFVVDTMSKDDFVEEYGESSLASTADWGSVMNNAPGWIERDAVRVAEYYWVEETKEKQKNRQREKVTRKIHWCKTNGMEVLESTDIPGEYIPIVPVLGEEIQLSGKRHLVGLVRYARTPQSLYNLWTSALAEAIAMAPKAPYMATPAQIEGYEDVWESANSVNHPYLPVNPDPRAPGWPQRQAMEPAIEAISAALAHADNDLKATFGLYDASLGKPGPEQSGRAILLRQQQGDSSTYGFQDAMGSAIKHCGRIITGWIPAYYDAQRVVRIVNPDGTSELIPINQDFQHDSGLMKCFDLTAGKYDVAVSEGKSYQAAREEAAASIMQLVQAQPELMQVVGDLLVKCMDWPMADEIADRLKRLLPPQLQDQGNAAALPQAQAQLAQAQGMIQQLTAAVNQLTTEKQGKVLEIASRERIAAMQTQAQVVMALTKVNAQDAQARADREYDVLSQQIDQAHEAGMASMDQAYTLQQQALAHQQQMQQGVQAHTQQLIQADHGQQFQAAQQRDAQQFQADQAQQLPEAA